MEKIVEKYPNDVKFVFRHYPLIGTPDRPFHDKAAISHAAAQSAGLQGKFWEMHDALFSRQSEWAGMTVDQFKQWATGVAQELGLKVDKFTKDMNSPEMAAMAQQAWDDAVASKIPGTPFVVINGNMYPDSLPKDFDTMSAIIDLILLEDKQFTSCPEMTIDTSKQYIATLHTTKGDITMELYADKAPLAVNSFIFLVNKGWFDNVMFHRVITDFVAQTGDPTNSGYGGPGYAFDNEIDPGLNFDKEGVVGMANSGAGSNGSQFFITLAPTPQLNGKYTIFAQVIKGMDVVKKLTPRDASKGAPLPEGDYITSITIEEK